MRFIPMRLLTQLDMRCGLFLVDLGLSVVVTSGRTFFLFRLLRLRTEESFTSSSSSSSSTYICLLLLWIRFACVLNKVRLNS